MPTLKFYFLPSGPALLAYLSGLFFYASHLPERAAPGRFDTLLASHQLWHVAIVVGVVLYWRGMGQWEGMVREGYDLSCAVR